jgi:hypothetical protein
VGFCAPGDSASTKPGRETVARELSAPFGLAWGSSEEQVRTVLAQFADVQRAPDGDDRMVRLITGPGTFAGTAVEGVEANLYCGELGLVRIYADRNDPRTPFEQWTALVEQVSAFRGEPDYHEAPPSYGWARAVGSIVSEHPARPSEARQAEIRAAQDKVTADILAGQTLAAVWRLSGSPMISVRAERLSETGAGRVRIEVQLMELGAHFQRCVERRGVSP